jgi:hypothetical protein
MKKNLLILLSFCLLTLITIIVFINHYNKSKQNKPNLPTSTGQENFDVYPFYPFLYKPEKELVNFTSNINNFKLLGNGNLLLYTRDPVTPYLIKCREDQTQKDLCDYIIGNQSKTVSFS